MSKIPTLAFLTCTSLATLVVLLSTRDGSSCSLGKVGGDSGFLSLHCTAPHRISSFLSKIPVLIAEMCLPSLGVLGQGAGAQVS